MWLSSPRRQGPIRKSSIITPTHLAWQSHPFPTGCCRSWCLCEWPGSNAETPKPAGTIEVDGQRERERTCNMKTYRKSTNPTSSFCDKARSQWVNELVPNPWRRQGYGLVSYLLAKHSSNLVLLYAFLIIYLIIIYLTYSSFLTGVPPVFLEFFPNIRSLTKNLRPKQNYWGKMEIIL